MNEIVKAKRQDWVDIAKGIAIIAVVVGHIKFSWPDSKYLPLSDLFVWLWHVPVFFMIGGFFLKNDRLNKPVEFVKGKVKSLYLPLLYIYIPVLLLHNLFIRVGFYDTGIEYYGKYVTWWGILDFLKHIFETMLCAGREPLLGAMWFGFVLFLALFIISITSWIVKYIGRKWSDEVQEMFRALLFLLFAVLSCSLTQLLGITIPRFNNTLVAVWLIYVGMELVQRFRVTFSNGLIAAASVVLAWHSATSRGG